MSPRARGRAGSKDRALGGRSPSLSLLVLGLLVLSLLPGAGAAGRSPAGVLPAPAGSASGAPPSNPPRASTTPAVPPGPTTEPTVLPTGRSPTPPEGSPTFDVVFSETGLPGGVNWGVSVTTSFSSGMSSVAAAPSTVSLPLPNGTYVLDVRSVPGYFASPQGGTLTVSSTSEHLAITFSPGPRSNYTVAFWETGLPNGTTWGISLAGTSRTATIEGPYGDVLAFVVPNGTYPYSIQPIANYAGQVINGPLQSVPVSGSSPSLLVRFVWGYSVEFLETGLPAGTTWWVALNGSVNYSTASTVVYTVPNGTGYPFTAGSPSGAHVTPSSGDVNVTGAAVRVVLYFAAIPRYSVEFVESGLPYGTPWTVSVGTVTNTSTAAGIVFWLTNGSGYTYVIGSPPAAYAAQRSTGNFSVWGSAAEYVITFDPLPEYVLVFSESGLPARPAGSNPWGVEITPSNASWSVLSNRTSGTSVGFRLPAGYVGTFVVSPPIANGTNPPSDLWAACTVRPATGNVVMPTPGRPMIVSVTFQCPSGTSSTPPFLGLPLLYGFALVGALAAAGLLVAGAVWARGRRRKRPPR